MKTQDRIVALRAQLPDRRLLKSLAPYFVGAAWPLLAIAVVVIIAIIVDAVFGSPVTAAVKGLWSTHIDPFIGIATLGVAVSVWFAQTRENAKGQLPKRLTVLFRLAGEELMRCNHAYLTDASAIREVAQTIGRQMADPANVKQMIPLSAPAIRLLDREILVIADEGPVQHFTVVFELTRRPTSVAEGVRVEWNPPFGPDDLVNIYVDGRKDVRRDAD